MNPPHPLLTVLPDLPSADHEQCPDILQFSTFDELRSALASYLETPGEAEPWARFLAVRRAAGAVIARLPRNQSQSPCIHEVHELVREMAKTGVHNQTVEQEDLALADEFRRKGWPGVLAAMLLVPAGQWPAAPLVMEVPDWLRPDYVRWLFSAPQKFSSPGQAEDYVRYTGQRLEELVRWMKRGPGGKEEMKVLAAYASRCSLLPLSGTTENLRRHAEWRGQLLRRAMGSREDHYRAPLKPRAGRRLRIGIIVQNFEPMSGIYAALPYFEKLDPLRFEVILFTYVSDFSNGEEYCRKNISALFVLPVTIKDQLTMLRNSTLDVAVFGGDLAADCQVVTRLALHRVAALQVAINTTGLTTGLPEIDLYASGESAITGEVAANYSERLGLMPGPTHVFSREVDCPPAEMMCTRADFNLPADGFVFVATAHYKKINPTMQQAWARLLAAVPGSRLLVHPFVSKQSSRHTISRFHAEFEGVLKNAGVDPARLVVSSVEFSNRAEIKLLVGLGDVFLDTFPLSGVEALLDPLELGLPLMAWEGETWRSRTGASLLRSLEMGALIAGTAEEYQEIAVRIARDTVFRERCRLLLRSAREETPVYCDARKASADFGALLETAFDELTHGGRDAFRADPRPVRAAREST